MSDGETFAVSLGGKTWAVPHLPFRVVKTVQPALFDVFLSLGGAGMNEQAIALMSEADLDKLAMAIWRAVSVADQALSYDAFLDLPFSVGDLAMAFPAVARAAGLKAVDQASQEAAPGEGK